MSHRSTATAVVSAPRSYSDDIMDSDEEIYIKISETREHRLLHLCFEVDCNALLEIPCPSSTCICSHVETVALGMGRGP